MNSSDRKYFVTVHYKAVQIVFIAFLPTPLKRKPPISQTRSAGRPPPLSPPHHPNSDRRGFGGSGGEGEGN